MSGRIHAGRRTAAIGAIAVLVAVLLLRPLSAGIDSLRDRLAGGDASVRAVELSYLATGDSVAAGADLGQNCGRSGPCESRDDAFPMLVRSLAGSSGVALDVTSVACSGATTLSYGHDDCGRASQATALAEHRWNVISITLGANDFTGWLTHNWQCLAQYDAATLLAGVAGPCDLRRNVADPLQRDIRTILAKATASADVVVVTLYYHLLAPSYATQGGGPPASWVATVNGGIDLVDEAIAAAAAGFGGRVLVVDLRPAFASHLWGDAEPFLALRHDCATGFGLLRPDCAAVPGIHPSAAGQRAIAQAVWRAAYDELVRRGIVRRST